MGNTTIQVDGGAPVYPDVVVPELFQMFSNGVEAPVRAQTFESLRRLGVDSDVLGDADEVTLDDELLALHEHEHSSDATHIEQTYDDVVAFIGTQLQRQFEHQVDMQQVITGYENGQAITRSETWPEYYSRRFDDEIINYWAGLAVTAKSLVVHVPQDFDFAPWVHRVHSDIRKRPDGSEIVTLERQPLSGADMMAAAEQTLERDYATGSDILAQESFDVYRSRRLNEVLRAELQTLVERYAHTTIPVVIQAPMYDVPRWDAVIMHTGRPEMAHILPDTQLEYSDLVVFIARSLEVAYEQTTGRTDEEGLRSYVNQHFDDSLVYVMAFAARLMHKTGQTLRVAMNEDEYTPWLDRVYGVLEAASRQYGDTHELVRFDWQPMPEVHHRAEVHDLGVTALTEEEEDLVQASFVPAAA